MTEEWQVLPSPCLGLQGWFLHQWVYECTIMVNLTLLSFCIPCCAPPEAVESGLPLDVHSALNYAYLSMRPPHKQYSPKALNQAVEDFQTGKFNSIRACARHHGVPMTTLHYRVKLKLRHSEVR